MIIMKKAEPIHWIDEEYMCAMGIAVYVCISFLFFFLKEKGKKKNNTHASACIIQRGGSRRPKNEGWSVWLGAHRSVYIRIRRKEQPKRKFRRSCCSDEYLKMPAAHGRTDGRTRICQKEKNSFFRAPIYTRDMMDSFWFFFFFFHRLLDRFLFLYLSRSIWKKGCVRKIKIKMGCAGKITPPRQGWRAPQR